MDPATIGIAVTAASSAFSAIKKGFQMGREIESMGKDFSRWMGAISDVDNAEKTTKNPSALQKLFKGKELEASAIEAFTAKKKLEAQRQELKSFINFHYGANSWNEILKMEADISLLFFLSKAMQGKLQIQLTCKIRETNLCLPIFF